MSGVKLLLMLICAGFLFTAEAVAQTNVWTTGFPKKGTAAASVDVAGTATAQAGWTLTGQGTVTYFKTSGGTPVVLPIAVTVGTGAWSGTFVSDFGAIVEITIIVQAVQRNNNNVNEVRNIIAPTKNITP